MKLFHKILIFINIIVFITLGILLFSIYISSSGLPSEYLPNYYNDKLLQLAKKEISQKKFGKNILQFENIAKKHSIPLYKITIKADYVTSSPIVAIDSGHPEESNFREAQKRTSLVTKYLQNLISRGANIMGSSFYIYPLDSADAHLEKTLYQSENPPPIFAFAANKNSFAKKSIILFPDDYTLSNNRTGYYKGWNILSQEILEANYNFPWDSKLNQVVWRGMLWENNKPRHNLIKIASKHAHINASGTSHSAEGNFLKWARAFINETMALNFSLGNFISQADQVKYRMLLNIDGYSCTYPGFQWRLLSNSVTLKQSTNDVQWFYELTKPWVHYVPIKEDLDDLTEKISWVSQNDNKAKKIAKDSTELVKNNLMPRDVDYYVVTLLNLYAEKHN